MVPSHEPRDYNQRHNVRKTHHTSAPLPRCAIRRERTLLGAVKNANKDAQLSGTATTWNTKTRHSSTGKPCYTGQNARSPKCKHARVYGCALGFPTQFARPSVDKSGLAVAHRRFQTHPALPQEVTALAARTAAMRDLFLFQRRRGNEERPDRVSGSSPFYCADGRPRIDALRRLPEEALIVVSKRAAWREEENSFLSISLSIMSPPFPLSAPRWET
ncbi:hypothetical protein MRX96_009319 [Rhipicephalus microplus]